MKKIFLVIVVLLSGAFPLVASASTLTVQPTIDGQLLAIGSSEAPGNSLSSLKWAPVSLGSFPTTAGTTKLRNTQSTTYPDGWTHFSRGVMYFNLNSLPENAVINSAQLQIKFTGYTYNSGYGSNYGNNQYPDVGLTGMWSNSPGTMTTADYYSCFDEEYDQYQSPTAGTKTWNLPASAFTDLKQNNFYVSFCLRTESDIKGWSMNKGISEGQPGVSYDFQVDYDGYNASVGDRPQLVVDYSVPATETHYLAAANQLDTAKVEQILDTANDTVETKSNSNVAKYVVGFSFGALVLGYVIFYTKKHS